jgi:alcohol dehydrogenase (cytochrome c)
MGGLPIPVDGQDGKSYGNFKAIDESTGKVAWTYKDPLPMMGGTLTTAGGVVFTSNVEGDALAFDSKTGKQLWSFPMGGSGRSQPIAFEIDGEPYLAIGSGGFATLESFAGATTMNPEGNVLHVFKVDKNDLKSAQSSGAPVKKASLH